MSNYGHKRLEKRIQEIVGTLIVTGEIKNPHINPLVSVSSVILSKDNAYATVWISAYQDDDELEQSVAALQSAAGFIQQRLGRLLKTRNTPHLTFKSDTSIREARAINELIDRLHREQ